MLLGLVLGFAVGVAAGWMGAPLAGAELRRKATSSSERSSLADSLKKHDQTVSTVRDRTAQARERLSDVQQTAGETAAHAVDSAKRTLDQAQVGVTETASRAANKALSGPRGLVDAVKDRIDVAREAARDGYDEGIRDARLAYIEAKKDSPPEEAS